MSKSYAVRRAQANLIDATLLQDVEHDSLGDSDYTPGEMLAVLRRPEQVIYLACDGGAAKEMPSIIGFCACLVTSLDATTRCLEVDMLGVRASHRGRGVATQLIRCAMQDARVHQITTLRAVIAEDNLASQKAFARAGLARTEPIRRMLVHELEDAASQACLPQGWRCQLTRGTSSTKPGRDSDFTALKADTYTLVAPDGRQVAQSQCLEAFTLAYSGLWIESLQGASPSKRELLAHALVLRAKQLRLDEVGCLVPTDDGDLTQALISQGYQDVGRYWVHVAELPKA